MSSIQQKNGRAEIVPTALRLGGVLASVRNDEATTRGELTDGTFSPTFENVTVEGTFTASALVVDSVAPAITAKAGGGQDVTLALSKNLNIVTTVATAADSVTLPAAVVGQRITIVNLGANTLAVFPYTSDSINDVAADASVTQDPETTVTYNCYTGVLWQSDNESLDAFDKIYTGDGTASLPAVTFASDKDNGLYRIGANNYALSVAGSKVLELGSAGGGISVTGAIASSTGITAVTTLGYGTLLTEGLTTGVTAFAGGGQASATAITTSVVNVTTCATAGDSVKLPAAAAGLTVTIKNSGATALDIFPASSDSIDALAVNLAVRIAPLSVATFRAIDATVWESSGDSTLTLVSPTTNTGQLVIQAAASAGNTQTTIVNASQAAARTYTIPDAGANAAFVMSEGATTVVGAKTFTANIVPTGGIAAAGGFASSPRNFAVGGLVPAVSTDFTDATPVNTETYIGEVFVPANCTVTGIAVFNGSNVTDNIIVALANSSGAIVAQSISTAGSGTDAYQRIPFTGTYAAVGPATYYVLSQYAGSTSRYNAPPLGSFGASKKTGEVFGTFTTITPPTTFTTNLCNIASLY